jgi:hypothetical protein
MIQFVSLFKKMFESETKLEQKVVAIMEVSKEGFI